MNRFATDARYLLEQYELLRLETYQGHGLHLFLNRGMVAWVEAVSCLSGRQAAPTQLSSSLPEFSSRPEMTTVLANMVLGCMQEVHL